MTAVRTIVLTVVDPTPKGPRRAGVVRVTRLRPRDAPIVKRFEPERAELIDIDFDALSDSEISALPGATDE